MLFRSHLCFPVTIGALTRIEMQQLIERLWQEQGFTALLITHDVEEAVVLADRVVLIENGSIALDEKISLLRPRTRGDAEFARTVEKILNRVMGEPKIQREFDYLVTTATSSPHN